MLQCGGSLQLTLLLVHSDDDHTLVTTDADELVDGADTSTRQLTQENHAFDVVVLQQADIGAHLSDGPHVDHHHVLHLWEPVLVEATAEPRHRYTDNKKKKTINRMKCSQSNQSIERCFFGLGV